MKVKDPPCLVDIVYLCIGQAALNILAVFVGILNALASGVLSANIGRNITAVSGRIGWTHSLMVLSDISLSKKDRPGFLIVRAFFLSFYVIQIHYPIVCKVVWES